MEDRVSVIDKIIFFSHKSGTETTQVYPIENINMKDYTAIIYHEYSELTYDKFVSSPTEIFPFARTKINGDIEFCWCLRVCGLNPCALLLISKEFVPMIEKVMEVVLPLIAKGKPIIEELKMLLDVKIGDEIHFGEEAINFKRHYNIKNTIQQFGVDNFVNIALNIMLEEPTIFIGNVNSLLKNIYCFLYVIQPFKWVNTMTTLIPFSISGTLTTFLPVILGCPHSVYGNCIVEFGEKYIGAIKIDLEHKDRIIECVINIEGQEVGQLKSRLEFLINRDDCDEALFLNAFQLFFKSILGGYTPLLNPETNFIGDEFHQFKENVSATAPVNCRKYVRQFEESQLFMGFIREEINRLKLNQPFYFETIFEIDNDSTSDKKYNEIQSEFEKEQKTIKNEENETTEKENTSSTKIELNEDDLNKEENGGVSSKNNRLPNFSTLICDETVRTKFFEIGEKLHSNHLKVTEKYNGGSLDGLNQFSVLTESDKNFILNGFSSVFTKDLKATLSSVNQKEKNGVNVGIDCFEQNQRGNNLNEQLQCFVKIQEREEEIKIANEISNETQNSKIEEDIEMKRTETEGKVETRVGDGNEEVLGDNKEEQIGSPLQIEEIKSEKEEVIEMDNSKEDVMLKAYGFVKEMIKGSILEKYLNKEIIKDVKHHDKTEVTKSLQQLGLGYIVEKNKEYFN